MDRRFKNDRGLPGSIDENRLAKLLKEKRMPRVASITAAMAAGFEPVEGAPGHFRRAHAIWALRKATDGRGFVIVRLRDEPAPGIDPRRATTVVVEVHTEEAPEEIVAPERSDEIVLIPLTAQLYSPGDPRLKDDEYAPEGGSEKPLKKKDISRSFGHASDIGSVVTIAQSFSPSLYGDALVIPKGRVFEVAGHSAADPDTDRFLGLGFDEPTYPGRGQSPAKFTRIRLQDELTGVEIAVLPWEFDKFIQAEDIKPMQQHTPSRQRAPTVPGRPINTREESEEYMRRDTEITAPSRAAQLTRFEEDTVDLGPSQTAPVIPRDPRALTTEQIFERQEQDRQMRIDRGVPAEETMDLFPDAEPS